MAIECVYPITSTDDFVSVGNYALWLIRKTPYLTKASDVNADFIVDLSVELFGTNILSHPRLSTFLPDNLTSVIHKLSNEIGTDLDHIRVNDLIDGVRTPLAHILELLTAFIAHCIEESLLDFDNSESMEITQFSLRREDKSSKTPIAPDENFSTSPELPRSVGRLCPSTQAISQLTPCRRVDALHDSCIPLTHSVGDATAPSGRLIKDAGQNTSTLQQFRHSCRHPSIASLWGSDSPPSTPQALDELLEIVNHPSPDRLAPSLKSSPVSQPNNVGSTPYSREISTPEHHHVILSTDLTTTFQRPSSVSSYSDCAEKTRISYHHKVSSSSSGRGHSPTHTLTAAASLPDSSCPPSLSSSSSPSEAGEANYPDDYTHSNPVDNREKQHQEHLSCSDQQSTGTESILAWNDGNNEMRGAVSGLSSFLSSTSVRAFTDNSLNCPSANDLIKHTEGFTKALRQRLDYLKNVSNRAREEARAVNLLVETIGNQNSNLLQLMQTTVQCRETFGPNSREICQLLKQVLEGVNLLIEGQSSFHRLTSAGNQQEYYSLGTRSRGEKSRVHRPSNHHKISHVPSDLEFKQLMEMKYQYMQEALKLCRKELSQRRPPIDRHRYYTRCPTCNALY